MRGAVYLDEVESMMEGKRGRPRLTEEERAARGLDDYHVGDTVRWLHVPRDGYGHHIEIFAEVRKVGSKRLLLEFGDGAGKTQTAWVNKEYIAETTYKAGL